MIGEWFVVLYGEHAGRLHLRGWMKTAVKLVGEGLNSYEWLALSVCPRCHALVLADEAHAYGDREWAHEQWHAATDWPIPEELTKGAPTMSATTAARQI